MCSRKRKLQDTAGQAVSVRELKRPRLQERVVSSESDARDLVDRCWAHLDSKKCCRFWVSRTDVPAIERRRQRHIREPQTTNTSGPTSEAKLNPTLFRGAIYKISKILCAPRVLPTIDCFATRKNAQQTAGCMYITRMQDFFSSRFDCGVFWSLNVAWAHPPWQDGLLYQTIDVFAKRRMRGYVCGPKWAREQNAGMCLEASDARAREQNAWLEHARIQSGYKAEVNLGGRGKSGVYLSMRYGYRSDGGQKSAVDVIVVYFDFKR